MPIKLIAIDMDGTLLKNDKTLDQDFTFNVFKALNEQNRKVLINSGNSIKKLHSYFNDELMDFMYFGGDDGNYLVQGDQVIHKLALSRSLTIEILNEYSTYDFIHPVASMGDKAFTLPFKNSDDEKEVHVYYDEVNVIDKWEDMPDQKIIKLELLSRQSLAENKELCQSIMAEFPETSAVTSGDDWVDVYHHEGGKSESVKYLQEKYQITYDETIAFGDSLNDISMLEEAKYRIGVANADEDLLDQYCNYKIPSNEDEAVQHTLKKFLDEGNLDFLEQYKI